MSNPRDEHFSGFAELLLDKMFVTKDYEQYHLLKRIIAQSAYAFACHVVSSTNEHQLRMVRAGMWSIPQCVDQILDMTEWSKPDQEGGVIFMSCVTNLILHIGILENKNQKIKEVNEYFLQRDEQDPLVSLVDEKLPRDWYGGTKRLECNLYIGAYNYLQLDEFIDHLKSLTWQEPESLQLIIKEQEDDKFRIIDVFAERVKP